MRPKTKKLVDQRLARIEGQVKAVRRLVEEDRYCVDVVRQVQAARAALASMETLIIEDHVDTCSERSFALKMLQCTKTAVARNEGCRARSIERCTWSLQTQDE